MVVIGLQPSNDGGALPLGTVYTIDIQAPHDVTWRAFARFESVVYVAPLAEGRGPSAVRFFPESPGRYEIRLVWTTDSGARGVATQAFALSAGQALGLSPVRVRVDDFDVWVPTGWDAMHAGQYERSAIAAIRAHVTDGMTAYDIGANLGLFTVPLLQQVGPAGAVYAFELNPICVQCLQATIDDAGHRHGAIFPVALGDTDGTVEATINFGSTALGITSASSFYAAKVGARLVAPSARLDTLIDRFALAPPDFIKIDVEGAEAMVTTGMIETLQRHRPTLLFELHGCRAAYATLKTLDPLRYSIEDLQTSRRATSAAGFLDGLADRPTQVLCAPET